MELVSRRSSSLGIQPRHLVLEPMLAKNDPSKKRRKHLERLAAVAVESELLDVRMHETASGALSTVTAAPAVPLGILPT